MKTYLIALGILIALGLWMLSGLGDAGAEDDAAQTEVSQQEKPPTQVRVRTIHAQDKQIDVVLRGRTEAKRIVDVTAEVAGKVIATPVEKGQNVKKGDVLCELAEEDRIVQLSRAKASLEKAQLDYDGSKKLFDDGLISSAALAASKSALESERATLKQAQLDVDNLKMRAPFDAFVEDRPAQVGAMTERGHVCARLMDESTLLAVSQATEKNITLLKLGQPVNVQLVDGRQLPGKITFIGRVADTQTRTYRVEAEISAQQAIVRDGVTAQIIVPVENVKAHQISPAVLALDKKDTISVRVVDENNIVELVPVSIVAEDIDGVWITGLPDTARLIVVGQELVTPGEQASVMSLD